MKLKSKSKMATAAVAMLVSGGCLMSEVDIKTIDTDDPGIYDIDCDPVDCYKRADFSRAELVDCFGSDFVVDVDASGDNMVSGDTGDTGLNCEIEFGTATDPDDKEISATNACGCPSYNDTSDTAVPPAPCVQCCELPAAAGDVSPYDEWSSIGSVLIGDLEDCSLDPTSRLHDPDDVCTISRYCDWVNCAEGEGMYAPGAEYTLHIDDTASYVDISINGETVQRSYLKGGGSMGSGPARFMSGLAWAQSDLTLDGVDFEDWYFWFDVAINIDLDTGDYEVDPSSSEVFKGQGLRDDVLVRASFDQPSSASGEVNAATASWDLDYTHALTEQHDLTLHLEGDLLSAP